MFLSDLLSNKKAIFGLGVLLLILFCAVFSPLLAPYSPDAQNLSARLVPPFTFRDNGAFHLFGTDQLGRDILSRAIYGARISLIVGATAALVAGAIGVTLGLISGYFGGWVDDVIMRICDIQLALPYILLAIAILAIVGAGFWNIIIVLSVSQWVTYARVARSSVLAEKEKEYVLAAKALGFGSAKIIFKYVLPNVFAPIIVIATFSVAQTIIAEASLSFLGLGLPPSIPTWGGMLSDGRTYSIIAWWLAVVPGLMITISVIAINLFGDWLRDYLDPKLKL